MMQLATYLYLEINQVVLSTYNNKGDFSPTLVLHISKQHGAFTDTCQPLKLNFVFVNQIYMAVYVTFCFIWLGHVIT